MRANKCDRCGNFYEDYKGIEYSHKGSKYNCMTIFGDNSKIFDLCPACMKNLIDWLDCEKVKGAEE